MMQRMNPPWMQPTKVSQLSNELATGSNQTALADRAQQFQLARGQGVQANLITAYPITARPVMVNLPSTATKLQPASKVTSSTPTNSSLRRFYGLGL